MRNTQFSFAKRRRSFVVRFLLLTMLYTALMRHSGLQSASASEMDGSTTNLVDLSVEQLMQVRVERVSGASRYDQEVTKAPASVSIVTADEIQKLGYRTLAEVLDGVGGLHITYDRNYAYLGMRGFGRPGDYNSRVLLLVDGHRVNDNIYDQAPIGTDGILDVDLIERVEVVRGPSSSIYGDNAFFGVINVITKRAGQINDAEVSLEGGSFETYKGRFTFGRKFGRDLEILLSGSWFDSAGPSRLYYSQFDDPANNYGVARDSDGDKYQSVFGTLRWKDLTFSGGLVNRTKKIPTASFGTVFNSRMDVAAHQN